MLLSTTGAISNKTKGNAFGFEPQRGDINKAWGIAPGKRDINKAWGIAPGKRDINKTWGIAPGTQRGARLI
jgi:hypothetical protein